MFKLRGRSPTPEPPASWLRHCHRLVECVRAAKEVEWREDGGGHRLLRGETQRPVRTFNH
jgi:hypothetical protein